ncbi:MAG: CDP-alcohol phosphatidyltransferase family protein [Halodesulfurarchaeum sp.]
MVAQWTIPTVATAGYELWFLRRHLDANHPEGASSDRYDSLGPANTVSLIRGASFAAVAGFALVDPTPHIAWVPAILYGGGCALDWIDGTVARLSQRETVLGEKLDMAYDTLGFLVAPLIGVLWGRLPFWYLSLSVVSVFFQGRRMRREHRGTSANELPTSSLRRPLAGLQMAFITVALAPVLSPATVRVVAAVVLTPSLIVFGRDYLVVAGYAGRRNNNY